MKAKMVPWGNFCTPRWGYSWHNWVNQKWNLTNTPSPVPRVSRWLQMILAFSTAYLKGKHFYNKTKSIDLSFRRPEVPVQSRVLIPVYFHIPVGTIHVCIPQKWFYSLEIRDHDGRKKHVYHWMIESKRSHHLLIMREKTSFPAPLPVGGTLWARFVRFPAVTTTLPGFSGNHTSSRWCLQIPDKKCPSWVRSFNLLILQSRMAGQERWVSRPHNLQWQM